MEFQNIGIEDIQHIIIHGKECKLFAKDKPQILLIQPSARHENKDNGILHEIQTMEQLCHKDFAICLFDTVEWAKALMPWHDEAVSHDAEVGLHAIETLQYIEQQLVPWLHDKYGTLPCIIGGYSLGGLFALWASMQTNAFDAVAAASPSLWIKGWSEYAAMHKPHASCVYMSLGKREEHCRNQRMARIGDRVREQYGTLCQQIGNDRTTLAWNDGGHFGNEAERTAKAFAWCANSLEHWTAENTGRQEMP